MKNSGLIFLMFILFACNPKQKQSKTEIKEEFWSIKFAESVLHEADSLIYYHRQDPKYKYDYAFLADAIYKLRDIDPKHGDYMKNYIHYFL